MKDMNQRLFVAIAIWLACIFGYYTFFAPKKPPSLAQKPEAISQPAATSPAPSPPVAGAPASPPKAGDVPRGTPVPRPPLREVTFQTPRTRIVVTSEGAAVRSVQLLGDKWTRHKGGKEESHVDLVEPRAGGRRCRRSGTRALPPNPVMRRENFRSPKSKRGSRG